MILLGVLASTPMITSELTATKPCRRKKREHQKKKPKQNKTKNKNKTTYTVDSRVVCREAFKFMYEYVVFYFNISLLFFLV